MYQTCKNYWKQHVQTCFLQVKTKFANTGPETFLIVSGMCKQIHVLSCTHQMCKYKPETCICKSGTCKEKWTETCVQHIFACKYETCNYQFRHVFEFLHSVQAKTSFCMHVPDLQIPVENLYLQVWCIQTNICRNQFVKCFLQASTKHASTSNFQSLGWSSVCKQKTVFEFRYQTFTNMSGLVFANFVLESIFSCF
jgi:hypothetical protein